MTDRTHSVSGGVTHRLVVRAQSCHRSQRIHPRGWVRLAPPGTSGPGPVDRPWWPGVLTRLGVRRRWVAGPPRPRPPLGVAIPEDPPPTRQPGIPHEDACRGVVRRRGPVAPEIGSDPDARSMTVRTSPAGRSPGRPSMEPEQRADDALRTTRRRHELLQDRPRGPRVTIHVGRPTESQPRGVHPDTVPSSRIPPDRPDPSIGGGGHRIGVAWLGLLSGWRLTRQQVPSTAAPASIHWVDGGGGLRAGPPARRPPSPVRRQDAPGGRAEPGASHPCRPPGPRGWTSRCARAFWLSPGTAGRVGRVGPGGDT